MIVQTLPLDEEHWSSDWIPISYKLNKKNFDKSRTFLWSEDYEVNAICRAYFMSDEQVEIGDVWLNENLRGKVDKNGRKYSIEFMKRVISKIWKIYNQSTKISLIVDKENIPAIKLYEKIHFKKVRYTSRKVLGISAGICMEREKQ